MTHDEALDELVSYAACGLSTNGRDHKQVIEWRNAINNEREKNRVKLLQYDNLRKHFAKLIKTVLGDNYYNMGMDVYTCDEITCEDLAKKLK